MGSGGDRSLRPQNRAEPKRAIRNDARGKHHAPQAEPPESHRPSRVITAAGRLSEGAHIVTTRNHSGIQAHRTPVNHPSCCATSQCSTTSSATGRARVEMPCPARHRLPGAKGRDPAHTTATRPPAAAHIPLHPSSADRCSAPVDRETPAQPAPDPGRKRRHPGALPTPCEKRYRLRCTHLARLALAMDPRSPLIRRVPQ